jgi:hypothetical protein
MSQAGFTPIQLYHSTTAAAAPTAGNLANGELSINITDGKLFYKDNLGAVQVLATKAGASGDVVGPASSTDNALVRFDSTTGKLVQNSVGILDDSGNLTGLAAVTMSGALTLSGGTANGVAYLNASKVLTMGAALTFDGAKLVNTSSSGAALIQSVDTSSTGSFLRIVGDASASGNYINWTTGTVLRFATSADNFGSFTERMRIDASGNVGIGTSTTAGRLTVSGSDFLGSAISQVRSGVGQWHNIVNASGGLTTRQDDITGTNDRLVIDSSGNVGIGTSTPQGTLHVTREGGVQPVPFGSEPQIVVGGSQGGGGVQGVMGSLWFASAELADTDFGKAAGIVGVAPTDFSSTSREGYLEFYTTPAGSVTPAERMRINSAGNVGIGTSNPGAATKLNVAGRGLFTGGAFDSFDGTPAGVSISYDTVNSVGVISAIETGVNEKTLRLRGSSLEFYATGEKMRITSAGNVGIGTSSPSAPLTIKSRASDNVGMRVLQSSGAAAVLQFTDDPVTTSWATFVATSTYLQTASAGFQIFDTGGIERMRITSAGNVGIGTNTPDANLTVNGAASFAAGTALLPSIARSGDLNTGFWFPAADTIAASTAGSERMRIDSSGNVVIGTTTALGKLSSIQNFGNGATATSFTASALGTAQGQLAGYSFRPTFVGGVDNGPRRAADIWSGFSTLAWGTEFLAFGVGRNGAANDASDATIERMRIDGAGNVLVTGGGGLGYGAGSGGAVTQATSRTTGVTLNEPSGAITLVSAAGSILYQSFTVTNSKVAATDTIIVNQKSGTDLYITNVTAVAAGSFRITFATTGGTTTEQPVFNFAIIKAATT